MRELLENMGYNQEGSTISASRVRGTTSSGFVSLSLSARSMTMTSLMFSDVPSFWIAFPLPLPRVIPCCLQRYPCTARNA